MHIAKGKHESFGIWFADMQGSPRLLPPSPVYCSTVYPEKATRKSALENRNLRDKTKEEDKGGV